MNGEVRVRVLAAGVCQPDLMMREGFHPETPPLPFTPGWDLVGLVDRLGAGVAGVDAGLLVAALSITGAYSEFVCLPQRELVPVPMGLDAAEAVSLVLNYVTAYQMLHRSARVKAGQRVLIHGAAGGVGSALMQLGHLAELEMYGTCSSQHTLVIKALGGVPDELLGERGVTGKIVLMPTCIDAIANFNDGRRKDTLVRTQGERS